MKSQSYREHIAAVINRIISLFIFLGALIYFLIRILSYDISLNNRFLYFQLPFIIMLAILIVAYIIYIFGNYYLTYITLDDEYIKLQNRFFVKSEVIIPYKNIHLYTVSQSIFLKPYHTKRIILNSGSRNDKAEIDITVKESVASLIEQKINLAHCDKNNNGSKKDYRLPNKWLLFYSVLIPSKWIRPVGYTLSIITLIALTLTNNETLPFGLIIVVYFISIIISIGLNAVYMILKYYNFSITKEGDCILGIGYGKMQKYNHFISTNKINGILIKQDILSQISKTYHPFLYVAGYKNKGEEVSLPLLPVVKNKDFDDIISNFFNQFHIKEKGNAPTPRTAITYYLPLTTTFNIIALPLLVFFIIIGEYLSIPIYILLQTLILLNSHLSYKNTRLYHNENLVYAKKGGLLSSGFLCKKDDIQALVYKHTYFNKKRDIHKLKLFIKAIKKKAFAIGYMDTKDTL